MTGGWYEQGSSTPIVTTYINPNTGKPYTPSELSALGGGTTTATTTTTPTTSLSHPNAPTTPSQQGIIFLNGEYIGPIDSNFSGLSQSEQEAWIKKTYGVDVTGKPWSYSGSTSSIKPTENALTTPQVSLPSLGSINVPAPAVTPAPEYKPSPEQLAWEQQYGTQLHEWLEAGGYGIPEETQALMAQQTTDVLKAKETEDIRVMRNNMERRGITNSGFIFSNEQKIKANTTMTLAKSITDVKIQSAIMKMASFEKAMGATAQFLGYLSEQSQLKYQPEFATWQAQQQATLYQYQAKMDLYKTQLQQAYTQQNMQLQQAYTQQNMQSQQAYTQQNMQLQQGYTQQNMQQEQDYKQQNMQLQAQISMAAQKDQQAFEEKMAQMEMEAQAQAAKAQGAGQMIVGLLGLVAASF